MSTGRAPMAQPPGSDTSASPKRATSGPSTRIAARMVLTSSYGAKVSRDRARIDLDPHPLVDGDARAHAAEQLDHGRDVLQVRDVADRDRAVRQQRAGQDRQRRVLGAGNAHLAVEGDAALDLQLVHLPRLLSGRARPAERGLPLRRREGLDG